MRGHADTNYIVFGGEYIGQEMGPPDDWVRRIYCGDVLIEYSEEEYDIREAAGDICPVISCGDIRIEYSEEEKLACTAWDGGVYCPGLWNCPEAAQVEECAVKNCVSCFSDNSKKCETCKEGFKAKKGGKKCKKTKKGKKSKK